MEQQIFAKLSNYIEITKKNRADHKTLCVASLDKKKQRTSF